MKVAKFVASLLLLLAVLLVVWRQARRPLPVSITPVLTAESEYCLTCHADLAEISPSHPLETFGCILCHGGERLALDADLAHSTLRGGRNPSDLSVVELSCGGNDCHSKPASRYHDIYGNHIQRVHTSIQATYAGAIAQVRYAFGAQENLRARQGILAVEDTTSASGITSLQAFAPDQDNAPPIHAFAQNCLFCHLSAEPLEGRPYARLTGCAACHTPTATVDPDQPLHKLTLAIPYSQCNTCHNRGNYSMVDMTFHARQDVASDRLHDYYQPIAQFTRCEWTLDCADCHTRLEAMGDGDLYSNKHDIQYVQCRTCHGTLSAPPATRTVETAEDIGFYLAFLNPFVELQVGDRVLITDRGEPLWNIRQAEDGSFILYRKSDGNPYTVPLVLGSGCLQEEDKQESRYCHACHSVER